MIEALVTPLPTVGLPRPQLPAIPSLRVEVVRGPDAGACLRATTERVVIGTHPTADLVLTDRTVSRFHLELATGETGVVLRDLGSRNRTLVDSLELVQATLRGPAIVTIGSTELRIDLAAELVPLQLSSQERFGELVGVSPAMRLAFARLHAAADHPGHLLIEGERGTGKALAAAALHELGARRDQPLDVIDCAAPALVVEAQLFGRGEQPGALERCHRGTLVLDEIGELARGTQRLLVRALEDRAVRRGPASECSRGAAHAADVRVLALSRKNLRIDVNTERFAPELFERVAGARVRLPPLRERPEDIPLLVARILEALGATGTPAAAQLLAPESIERLRASPWPGNVRELRGYVEGIVACGCEPDDAGDPPLVDGSLPLREARERWVRYFERTYVEDLLARTAGNVSAAAVLAGVDRVYMHRMITRAGLREQLSRARR